MKLSTNRDALFHSLQLVTRAVSTRSAIQSALSGILLVARDAQVELRATDNEIALRTPLDATVHSTGSTVLPGRLLLDVVRALPDAELTLALDEAQRDVEITAGPATFHLRALPADEFPTLPDPHSSPIALPAQAFVETVERVARAASSDEARPILTGVHVTVEGSELTMVATDSYRLAVKKTSLEEQPSEALEATIPARALRELARLTDGAETLEVSLHENQVVVGGAGSLLSSRLLDGQFPNHRQLLPESFEHDVRVPRQELLDIVRRVSLLAQKNAPLRMRFTEGEIAVSAETEDVGGASEAMPAGYQGEPFEIGFNPAFLREGIEAVQGDELLVRLIQPLRPVLLEAVEGDDFRYLVMPIRLNAQ